MKILLTGPIEPEGVSLLEQAGRVVLAAEDTAQAAVAEIADAQALLVRRAVVDAWLLAQAPDLRVIGRHGVGYENIAVEAATARGIPVAYAPGVNARAVAEHAFGMIFHFAKRVRFWDAAARGGRWNHRLSEHSRSLEGATLGLVGFGNIGKEMAAIARALGMRVLASDPYCTEKTAHVHGARLVPLAVLCREADYLSLHAPATPETRGMISAELIGTMKPDAVFINCARGELVDFDALTHALEAGCLGGAGLDVFPVEPPDLAHPIFRRSDVVCSPHCASHTRSALVRMATRTAQGILDALMGRRPEFLANPEVYGP